MSYPSSSVGDKLASAPRPGFQRLAALQATNRNPSERYLLIFDWDTTPQPGDVPQIAFPIPPAANGSSGQITRDALFFTTNGLEFRHGAAWAISTAPNVFLEATAAEHTVLVVHV